MKILYIFDEDDKYGAPKTGMELICYLKNNFSIYPIVITSKKNNVNKICDDNGIENYVTYHHKYTYVQNSSLKSKLKFIPRFIRYKIGNIVAMKILKNKIDFNTVDLIHSNISGLDLGALLSKKYSIKNVMHIREFGDLDFNMKSYRKNYISFLNNNVDYFITISNAIKEHWIKKGLNEQKITTIYNGINFKEIKQKVFKNSEHLKILMMGSISRGKGQCELVEAISLLQNEVKSKISVDIVGSGYKEAEDELRNVIRRNNLDDIIHLVGYDANIQTKIKKYDVGIVCSNAEGFGRVTVEYMASGLIVIASDTGANPELIENNVNGFLYKKGDFFDLANKIEFVLSNKENDVISKNAQKRSLCFSVENFGKNINAFYEKMLFIRR